MQSTRSRSAWYDVCTTSLFQQQLQQQFDRICGKNRDVPCEHVEDGF